MKRRWILLLALVALIAALWTALDSVRRREGTVETARRVYLINEAKSNLEAITIDRAGDAPYTILYNVYFDANKNAIESDEPLYLLENEPDFAVDVPTALNMVNHVLAFEAQSEVLGATDALDAFGLAQPRLTVTARLRDGGTRTILFGAAVPTGTYVYVKTADSDAVYIVFETVFDVFDLPRAAVREGY